MFGPLLLAACQKRDEDNFQSDNLKINITKPAETSSFRKGDTVFIEADVYYTSQLHGYSIEINNQQGTQNFFTLNEHVHGDRFNVNTYWIDTLSQSTDLLLKLTVQADHEGSQQSKEVRFKSSGTR